MLSREVLRLRCHRCGARFIVDNETYQQGSLYVCPDCEAKEAPMWLRQQPTEVLLGLRRRFAEELAAELPGTITYKRAFTSWAQVDAELLRRGMTE